MGMAENMGGNMFSWNFNLSQNTVNIGQVVRRAGSSRKYIAPVLVLATKAVAPAAPLFLSLVA